ncbi:hypothetical protein [Acetobacter sp. AN02]|nr:hypothetical protein [Acetobacter sp. AN02]
MSICKKSEGSCESGKKCRVPFVCKLITLAIIGGVVVWYRKNKA